MSASIACRLFDNDQWLQAKAKPGQSGWKIATNTVMQIDEGAANVISITTETNGAASLEMAAIQNAQSPKTETITGSWEQVGDFFILERTNGGFVALRISSEVTTNQLTVVARTGQTIQFNRIP
jgi:hypothetical protein